jgi:multiple sugar transport system permease protein
MAVTVERQRDGENRLRQGTSKGGRRRERLPPYERRRRVTGFLFVLPSVLFVMVLFFAPLVMTGWMSLHDWPLLGGSEFLGLDNYQTAASDSQFLSSVWFTTKFTVITAVLTFFIGFSLALLVRGGLPGTALFRTSYFLPVVIGYAVASFLWVWMFNDQVGMVNHVLELSGIVEEAPQWFANSGTALAGIVIMTVWKVTGFAMLVLLVGMQGVPQDLYEAARVDGATRWAEIRYVMIPLLRPTFALILVFLVTAFYLGFDQFYIMTRGGPRNSTITIVYWIFNNAFVGFRLGYGATLAILLLLALVIVNGVQLYLVRKDPTR